MPHRNTVFLLGFTKFVISVNEHLNYCPHSINSSVKTTASARQPGNVMPEVGIYAFNNVSIAFIADISDVLTRKNNIKIAYITVCTI